MDAHRVRLSDGKICFKLNSVTLSKTPRSFQSLQIRVPPAFGEEFCFLREAQMHIQAWNVSNISSYNGKNETVISHCRDGSLPHLWLSWHSELSEKEPFLKCTEMAGAGTLLASLQQAPVPQSISRTIPVNFCCLKCAETLAVSALFAPRIGNSHLFPDITQLSPRTEMLLGTCVQSVLLHYQEKKMFLWIVSQSQVSASILQLVFLTRSVWAGSFITFRIAFLSQWHSLEENQGGEPLLRVGMNWSVLGHWLARKVYQQCPNIPGKGQNVRGQPLLSSDLSGILLQGLSWILGHKIP